MLNSLTLLSCIVTLLCTKVSQSYYDLFNIVPIPILLSPCRQKFGEVTRLLWCTSKTRVSVIVVVCSWKGKHIKHIGRWQIKTAPKEEKRRRSAKIDKTTSFFSSKYSLTLKSKHSSPWLTFLFLFTTTADSSSSLPLWRIT